MEQNDISKIIEKNLSLMQRPIDEQNSFQRAIAYERIGGNNNYWNGFPCLRTSFYYNPNNGEIIEFVNHKRRYNEVKKFFCRADLKIAVNGSRDCLRSGNYLRIVSCKDIFEEGPVQNKVIQKTIELFNENYGFKVN